MLFIRRDIFSLFWVLAGILFLRTFIFEPFQIPTGSMIPTLLVGDHLFVAKSAYDFKVPFTQKSLLKVSDPNPGDIIVFEYPNIEKDSRKDGVFYIKRIIGTPGDTISIQQSKIFINSKAVEAIDFTDPQPERNRKLFSERIPTQNFSYLVQNYVAYKERFDEEFPKFKRDYTSSCAHAGTFYSERSLSFFRSIFSRQICEFQVPKDSYFVMGDNRDDSEDSRFWGFVHRSSIRGKAIHIFMSINDLNSDSSSFNWHRFGLKIR